MNKEFKENDISHTPDILKDLSIFLKNRYSKKIYLITDENCKKHCLPKIKSIFENPIDIFTIKPGEKNKNINTVIDIWKNLMQNEVDRDSLIINLGGGTVCDIGGFAASTFKRGIDFINIPTTLLAQIDASAGGKTGINFEGLKNQIGTFYFPEKVFISDIFFDTLPEEEFMSGFGEMIKHALIYNYEHYFEIIDYIKNDFRKKNFEKLPYLVKKSVNIKLHFVKKDITDKGYRNILNFGHTFGHTFESLAILKNKNIKHGTAIAYGILYELFLSVTKKDFDKKIFDKIKADIIEIFGKPEILKDDFEKIYLLMKQDKKNKNGKIKCVLLKKTENPLINNTLEKEDIFKSLDFFV